MNTEVLAATIPSRPDIPPEYAHIQGWGADLDHANRPGYPKERTPPRLPGLHWDEPPQQQHVHMQIFHSTERPGITPVFGTGAPPSGLSGKLRAYAFKFSENDIRHWFILLFADRINMLEGLGEDFQQGRLPNLFAEMGLKSEFKYNRPAAIKKAVIGAAVVGIGYYLITRKRQD